MYNRRGTSIIEIMVVIVVLSVGIVGAYNIVMSGQKLSATSTNKIKAINIAREGLELVENIRDTNWLKFSSDYDNCWKVRDYNPSCIGTAGTYDIPAGSYILSQDSDSRWTLESRSQTSTYTGSLVSFPVYINSQGLISGTGGSSFLCNGSVRTNCKTIFTREIRISYPSIDHMNVQSIVHWSDNNRLSSPYTVSLETIFTNWKKKF